jgi:predicted kinase
MKGNKWIDDNGNGKVYFTHAMMSGSGGCFGYSLLGVITLNEALDIHTYTREFDECYVVFTDPTFKDRLITINGDYGNDTIFDARVDKLEILKPEDGCVKKLITMSLMPMEYDNKDRHVIITRGVSGAGKSTFCDLIAHPRAVCCADDYFMETGEYVFIPDKISHAHGHCRKQFDEALEDPKIKNIIIANTNCQERDFQYYVDKAEESGIMTTFVVLENRHGGENVHSVPVHVLERQENNLRNSLKLR